MSPERTILIRRFWFFFCILLAVQVFQIPVWFNFISLGFGDAGGFRNIDRLLNEGLRPVADFGYFYGLMPLLIQRGWYALLGIGPISYFLLITVYTGLMAWGWARIVRALKADWPKLFFIASFAPFLTFPGFASIAHAGMQVLMLHAVASIVGGDLPLSLLQAIGACLMMPSIPLILAATILGLVIANSLLGNINCEKGLLGPHWRRILPTVLAAILLLLIGFFGWIPLVSTLLPMRGRAHYAAMNYGLFKAAKFFWHPPGANWRYYLGTPAGIWILCTTILCVLSFGIIYRAMAKRQRLTAVHCAVLACFATHTAFVLFAFGHAWTTCYYFPILIAGVAIGLVRSFVNRVAAPVMLLLSLLSVLSQKTDAAATINSWRTDVRSAECAGLPCSPRMLAEWKPIIAGARTKKTFVFGYAGGIDSYFKSLRAPHTWILLPAVTTSKEKAEVINDIRLANVVVLARPNGDLGATYVDHDAAIQRELRGLALQSKGTYFWVWNRECIAK